MRTTENLSLRLDPEVVRLSRRTAEECRQTLREFFEAALRRHVAAVTSPEEQANLLSTVEEAFLKRMDKRLHEVLERVAALSAKEASDQAHTLQIVKRLLFMQVGDQKKTHTAIDQAWKEAVERVRSRGRPYPPEAVKELEDRLAAAEKLAAERAEQLQEAASEAQHAWKEVNKARAESRNGGGEVDRLKKRIQELERLLDRETWVSAQLEDQFWHQTKRKTAAELRQEHFKRQLEVDD
jgi:hypothetical protein